MQIDFDELTPYERYKLMSSLIVPRPIALVTTLSADGTVNAAPFSMFNMLGEEPPIVMVSINRHDDGALKDTAVNIDREGEFVVYLCDEAVADKMHRCGARLPSHVSELAHAGLNTAPSVDVAPPRIVEAPVAFECKVWETLSSESRRIFIGRVLRLHARDGLIDRATCRIQLEDYAPVGRLGGGLYTKTRDRFTI
ncbi:flavin reductase family protein [Pandoraea sputorum]|uniref:flavin reductase family protein n=1 Tax=Pandoraea sputorum TaxID=93222 RepID=UPI00123FCA7D|nr:flavin reductase family protein [Pandoraea sputorum]VVE78476.1 flavin reductase domain-containing protein [Pandoraea sputorum]